MIIDINFWAMKPNNMLKKIFLNIVKMLDILTIAIKLKEIT